MMNSAKRVLVVDDFDDSRFSLSMLLKIEGYEVIEATDGAQAIEKALSDRPDLILMDLSLPVIDGLSATRQIRQSAAMKRVPIIALTAHDLIDIQSQAEDAGCTDYAPKPIDFTLLIDMMAKYLGN
jgi:Response regulator containing CheY-like receiver, AAA-type ATPase, and DNA-binding domains